MADMKLHMVADMEVDKMADMVADMEVNEVADMVAIPSSASLIIKSRLPFSIRDKLATIQMPLKNLMRNWKFKHKVSLPF